MRHFTLVSSTVAVHHSCFLVLHFQLPVSRSPTFDRNAMVQPHQSHFLSYSALTSTILAMNIRKATYSNVSFIFFLCRIHSA